MNICEAKNSIYNYEREIKTRDDSTVLALTTDDKYKKSKRPDHRYWYRLAVREARIRGLT